MLDHFASVLVECFCFSRCSILPVLVESSDAELCRSVRHAFRPNAIKRRCLADMGVLCEGNYVSVTRRLPGRCSDVSKENGELMCGEGQIQVSHMDSVSHICIEGGICLICTCRSDCVEGTADDIRGKCGGVRRYEDSCMEFVDRWLEWTNGVELAHYCLERLCSDVCSAQRRRGVEGTFE